MPRPTLILTAALTAGCLLGTLPAAAEPRHCPPGLAKKAVPCVPPGQAKKKHRNSWHYGEPIYGDYVLIPRADWERLALRDYRDGSTYLRIDNQILRVARDTLTVIEAVRILDRALN
ncbi:excinuclease ABC subunit A [Tabrizicola sp. YIM 78059]|uniref:excinuclease ABC subunit A n=1 Tax=Tabrizicola sp. YIM 78059 TaxID=2529861 RepID=UPI0010AA7221|nr:excinuclease ABC subunit A [Tabrizicola sp. YIM 78059]